MLKVFIGGHQDCEAYCPLSGRPCSPYCSLLSKKDPLGWRLCLAGHKIEDYGQVGLRVREIEEEQ